MKLVLGILSGMTAALGTLAGLALAIQCPLILVPFGAVLAGITSYVLLEEE